MISTLPERYDVPKQHTNAQSLLLHLLPGALGTALYVAVAPRLVASAIPSLFGLMLCLTSLVSGKSECILVLNLL